MLNLRTPPNPDLADHFVACSKVGRYLTVFDESRFVITDDFSSGNPVNRTAAAVASIFSKDPLVAQAALVPLGRAALDIGGAGRDRYEELFSLIEKQTLDPEVRDNARSFLESGFREVRIHELEAMLGGKISAARARYRAFLEIVRQLIESKVSPLLFRDEFLDFTYSVAGRLDFGIYSFCLDRIFGNALIPLRAKGFLISELLGFPPVIRRELLTNILTTPGHDERLTDFVRDAIKQKLDGVAATEIDLLVALKTAQMSMDDIGMMLADTAGEA
ncbi:MAG: hypothetical protein HQ504_04920 [Rhodospirillaceae bacterium]|nr:hypothetical protein [Rhodospirillaceae bacterium]